MPLPMPRVGGGGRRPAAGDVDRGSSVASVPPAHTRPSVGVVSGGGVRALQMGGLDDVASRSLLSAPGPAPHPGGHVAIMRGGAARQQSASHASHHRHHHQHYQPHPRDISRARRPPDADASSTSSAPGHVGPGDGSGSVCGSPPPHAAASFPATPEEKTMAQALELVAMYALHNREQERLEHCVVAMARKNEELQAAIETAEAASSVDRQHYKASAKRLRAENQHLRAQCVQDDAAQREYERAAYRMRGEVDAMRRYRQRRASLSPLRSAATPLRASGDGTPQQAAGGNMQYYL